MKDLIFLSMVRWETIKQRPQQLALELSKYFRILYIDPVAYSLLGAIRNHLIEDHSRNFRPLIRKINENLTIYTPPPLIPFSEDYWFINEIDHLILWKALSKILLKYNFNTPILYLNHPNQLPLIKYFSKSLLCYDSMDRYEAFFKPTSRRSICLIQKEAELLSMAQIVFATSENLANRILTQKIPVNLVRNGVSDLFLEYSIDSDLQVISDFPACVGPIIGYAGAISNWFDIDAIHILATKHSDWRFVLIGPVKININSLKRLPNVSFLGIKEHSILPAYINKFDIATIPFKNNELTRDVNPVKIYEYFALGKTVVASNLPELQKFRDICYLADDTDDFVSKVEAAVQDLGTCNSSFLSELKTKRRNVALENSWRQRAEKIRTAICIKIDNLEPSFKSEK
jgi:hypothetical protein